ncbi:MAG: RNA polymerase factor sigma-54, partial [Hyphomicrobiales bacterium]|nr:RNA polymerase factor sigma-54 [Hyphomicrobiales bacterium]
MALNQRLELRQGQSLVMTPQLQQAIKLLQMSSHELQTFVEAELERNPLLERDETSDNPPGKTENIEPTPDDPVQDISGTLGDESATAEKLETMDTDLANVYADEARADTEARTAGAVTDSSWSSLRTSGGGGDGQSFNLEATLSEERTLVAHLTEQLNLAVSDPSQRLIGLHLIGMLNDAGYLKADMEALQEQLGASSDAIGAVLDIVRTFDPPGVFASDLKECLEIQLKERDRYDPAMQALVENLELLAKRDFAKLKKLCGVDLDDIKDMVLEIRELNPRPGNVFGAVVVQPVVPDVQVRAAPDGTWQIELNSETLPRVLVNNQYYATVSAGSQREEDKLYLSECLSNATWLVKSLDQRARTILAVSREIVRQQDAFLVHGVEALKPITLKTVAEAIDMHESTISRVTSNKYMATPRGIFELKYFFTTAISSSEGGDAHSSESVRHKIRELIDAETAKDILSDDMIVDILRE